MILIFSNFEIINDEFLKYVTIILGFLAQFLFSSRIIIQWISSEKKKKVSSDLLFWQISLIASFLFFTYGYLRDDFSIMLGQIITYYIYIRNIQLHNAWFKYHFIIRYLAYFFPPFIIGLNLLNGNIDFYTLFNKNNISLLLLIWGSVGQVIFTLRFVYQWIYSEKKKESALPSGFWILSIVGSFMILIYSIIRKDLVLFSGHIVGIFTYSRNLYLSLKYNK